MADFNVSIILKLVERLTGPAAKSVAALGRVKAASLAGARAGKRFASAFEEAENRLSRLGTASLAFDRMTASGRKMVGVLVKPTKEAGEFQSRLRSFGRVVDATNDQLKGIRETIKGVSADTALLGSDLLDGVEVLAGKGLDLQRSLDASPAIGRTATATGAALTDLALAGFAAIDNLDVETQKLERAFDAMGKAGQEGGFELKNMARWFPALTAQARALHLQGVPAVAEISSLLQFALKGAGSPDIAARNMENFMAKLTSPETVKRFSKFGVNLEDEMKIAVDRGISPLMHMLDLIQQITEGDQFRIGELFGDLQVQNFLRAVLPELEEVKKLTAKSLAAEGFIDEKFINAMEDYTFGTRAAASAMDELQRSVGRAILPIAGPMIKAFTAMAKGFSWFIDHTGFFGTAIALVIGAIGGLILVAGTFGSAVISVVGTGLILNATLKGLGISSGLAAFNLKALAISAWTAGRAMIAGAFRGVLALGRGLMFLALRSVPLAITGLRLLGVAAMANPIGFIIGLIAIGATLIIANWGRIAPFFKRLFGGIGKAIAPIIPVFRAVFGLIKLMSLNLQIGLMRGWQAVLGFFKGIFGGIGKLVAPVMKVFKTLFSWSPLGLAIRAWKPLLSFYKNLFKGILDIADRVFTRLKSLMAGPLKFLKGILGIAGKLLGAGAVSLVPLPVLSAVTLALENPEQLDAAIASASLTLAALTTAEPAPDLALTAPQIPALAVEVPAITAPAFDVLAVNTPQIVLPDLPDLTAPDLATAAPTIPENKIERPRLTPLPAPEPRPADPATIAQGAQTPGNVTIHQKNSFVIHAAPGTDERALANRIARMTKEEARRALHDGAG